MTVASAAVRTAQIIKPLDDSRWDRFVARHPQSSVFHTSGWLEALRRTYGYTPIGLTTSPQDGPLENCWLFCSIDSWLTGRRWVSLPFSDHCQPLGDDQTAECFLPGVGSLLSREQLRYIEVRPLHPEAYRPVPLDSAVRHSTRQYCFHQIDLTPDLQTLFRNCHKDSTQRKINRARREGLGYEEGRSERLLDAFYGMQLLTRHRHGLPPQPKRWFGNLLDCVGEAVKIRVAYRGSQPIAATLTIRHRDTMMYKYGGSDQAHHNLGGMHLLFWNTIEEAKRDGLRTLDLGRSDCDNPGLIAFKDRWGSTRSTLSYSRFTSEQSPRNVYTNAEHKHRERIVSTLFGYVPNSVARAVGELIYKHIG